MRERRKGGGAPFREQRFGEAFVVVGRERLCQRMRWKVRLHDHFARQVGAARAPGHLEQERGESLRRAEIAAVERIVGADDTDEREPPEIVALGEHLRADENVDRTRVHTIAHTRECALAPGAVAVDAFDASVRKTGAERALEPLRSVAERHEVDVAALGTSAHQPLGMAAMVATKIGGFAMDDEPCAAAGAPGLPAAGRAEERKRKPAPIDEDERLFASFEPRRERGLQRRADPLECGGVAARHERDRRLTCRHHGAPRQF